MGEGGGSGGLGRWCYWGGAYWVCNYTNSGTYGGDGGGVIIIYSDSIDILLKSTGLSGNSYESSGYSCSLLGSGGSGTGGAVNIFANFQSNSITAAVYLIDSTDTSIQNNYLSTDSFLIINSNNTAQINIDINSSLLLNTFYNSSIIISTNDSLKPTNVISVSLTIPENAYIYQEDSLICIGDTTTLEVVGNNLTYLWSTGDTTSVITVYPTQTTTYWVQSSSGGVSCTDSVTVIANNPQANLVSSITSCDSAVTILADSGYTYLWNSNDTTQSIIVSQSGNYIVTVDDGFCTDTDTVNVNLIQPTIQHSDTIICFGESILLNIDSINANILWSTGDTTNSITVSPTQTTTYWVQSSDVNNSCVDSIIITTITCIVTNFQTFNITENTADLSWDASMCGTFVKLR